jgi:hypothetical protein
LYFCYREQLRIGFEGFLRRRDLGFEHALVLCPSGLQSEVIALKFARRLHQIVLKVFMLVDARANLCLPLPENLVDRQGSCLKRGDARLGLLDLVVEHRKRPLHCRRTQLRDDFAFLNPAFRGKALDDGIAFGVHDEQIGTVHDAGPGSVLVQ